MTVLLDSWAWVEFFNGTETGKKIEKEYLLKDVEIIVSAVNIAEVYRHFLATEKKELAKKIINFVIARSFIVPVVKEIAIEAAKLKHEKKWGLGDALIYATALANKVKIVSGDPHFKNQENVIYIGK